MSLRLKLLLLGLLTLVLPWAGCQYARDVEAVLRDGERQALASVAQTIAASLQGRSDLLYRRAAGDDPQPPGPLDVVPIPLPGTPFVDTYADEWLDDPGAWRYIMHGRNRLGIVAGVHERMLYVLIDVLDEHLVFDAPGAEPLDASSFGDRVWIGFTDPKGMDHQVFVAGTGPGPVRVRHIETREYGRQVAVDEPRISGVWQPTRSGYRVELRMPLSMIGTRFGVLIDNRDVRGGLPTSFGTLSADDLRPLGRLIAASSDLAPYLAQFLGPGLALTVKAQSGAPLAVATAAALPAELGPTGGLLARVYRRFLDRPGERRRVAITSPIYDVERRHVIASLQVTQAADPWLTLRDAALTRLLNVTLITTAVAVLFVIIFAARLALRLSRLRRASETALTSEGLVTEFPETHAADELGDVARSFSTLLRRQNEYTGYLRTLAGKLAHEIRTPLTIVRSSLENLELVPTSEEIRIYLARAREGSDRLNAILIAMGAASRVEEAIQNTERTRFDLVPVIESAVAGYRMAFAERNWTTELPPAPVIIDGAPDLIVQMLDKLVDNAVDFSPRDATITLRARLEPAAVTLEVDNPGPTLPPATRGRLFESLWQSRGGSDSRPHFGLGLYIVRLIAEFHGGSAWAMDLPDHSGARFVVRVAR